MKKKRKRVFTVFTNFFPIKGFFPDATGYHFHLVLKIFLQNRQISPTNGQSPANNPKIRILTEFFNFLIFLIPYFNFFKDFLQRSGGGGAATPSEDSLLESRPSLHPLKIPSSEIFSSYASEKYKRNSL